MKEFTALLKPTVLGQLVEVIFEKMKLAGEAGPLLKIEDEIRNAIIDAKKVWEKHSKQMNPVFNQKDGLNKFEEIIYDVKDISDESFWDEAEKKIIDALITKLKEMALRENTSIQ